MAEQGQAFELRGVHKAFGRQVVLRDLSLTLEEGQFALLLGANGSGKTTLLRLCAGLSRPDKGAVLFAGRAAGAATARNVGHGGHQLFLYGNLTVAENIELFRGLAGSPLSVNDCLREWLLDPVRERRLCELSKGMQFRVSLCRAFIGRPRFLFLDEPTSSLDEISTELFIEKTKNVVFGPGEAGFVLVATHDVRRLRDCANRILVLEGGIINKDLSALRRERPDVPLEELKDEVVNYYLARNR